MTTLYLVLLILFGLLFLVAEIVLLPGVSVGAILALACYGTAVYLAYGAYGLSTAVLLGLGIFAVSTIATIFSLRAKTWQRFSLTQQIRSSSMPRPEERVAAGTRGTTLSRLAPMGKVEIDGVIYEAKSLDSYVDQHTEVEVVGFENFNVIVKKINQ